VYLSGRELFIIEVAVLAIFCFLPVLWERIEKFEPSSDFRLPYKLSDDYWLYSRYCRWTYPQDKILVIGDSVIWGHYVSSENTLSHYLNRIAGQDKFVNMGVDGVHPVALDGLLRYYGRDISGKDVILHFNPLWISSDKHDLQTEKEFNFNHPMLVPQFFPIIACYKASFSERISSVFERYIPFLSWRSHLNKAYFDGMNLSAWTIEHPYKNPLRNVALEIPVSDVYNLDELVSSREEAKTNEGIEWIRLENSLQWRLFQRSVELLMKRGNKVFVLVGPFNEHILRGKSIETYRQIKSGIEMWLQQNNVPFYIPVVLPSRLYRDASHPLSQGYAELARELFDNESFRLIITN
jgi:hypothetical protein